MQDDNTITCGYNWSNVCKTLGKSLKSWFHYTFRQFLPSPLPVWEYVQYKCNNHILSLLYTICIWKYVGPCFTWDQTGKQWLLRSKYVSVCVCVCVCVIVCLKSQNYENFNIKHHEDMAVLMALCFAILDCWWIKKSYNDKGNLLNSHTC